MEDAGGEVGQIGADGCHPGPLLGVLRGDVGGYRVHQGPDGMDHLLHHVGVGVVGVCVVWRVSRDLVVVLVLVLPEEQVVAILGGGERRRHEQGHEPVLRQLQLVDYLRPEKAEGVGERGEAEPGVELLGDRGPTHQVSTLQDQGLEPGLGEVGPVDQPVVAPADDHSVVLVLGCHLYLRLSFSGGCRTGAGSRWP